MEHQDIAAVVMKKAQELIQKHKGDKFIAGDVRFEEKRLDRHAATEYLTKSMTIAEKKKRLEEMKAKTSQKLSQSGLISSATLKTEAESSVPLSKNNLIIENDNVITKMEISTIKEEVAENDGTGKGSTKDLKTEIMYDPSLQVRKPYTGRKRESFNFFKPGEIVKKAMLARAKSKLQQDLNEIPVLLDEKKVDVPNIEWWDKFILERDNYDKLPTVDDLLSEDFSHIITELVAHPIKKKPPNEPEKEIYPVAYLTKKEQKKIRRQNRKEIQKEQAERVRLGLEKPPEPKVKVSNLMRVLGTEAVQDPTKMEAHVKKQVAERLKKHIDANAARKLSDEEKAEKKRKKMAEDTSLGVHVSIYKVKSLQNPSKKYKVETNAKQCQMTGIVIFTENFSIVVVEGGPKQQKYYKRLMLHRIKWNEEELGEAPSDDKNGSTSSDVINNECNLIWEGIVLKRNFTGMKSVFAENPKQARDLLEKHKVAHYWDYVINFSNIAVNDV
uniref:U4/U6 small nuclear ribonucleoprotein Prp3 (inferred by orthology to a human protein) n=1 Tax=Strongyloides venezuelensis TaxID=75913 RepID=A0A0K0FGG0_STRVS